MPAIDGQTAGPTGLKFYLEYPRGNIKGKRNSFFFSKIDFFSKSDLKFHGQHRALQLVRVYSRQIIFVLILSMKDNNKTSIFSL